MTGNSKQVPVTKSEYFALIKKDDRKKITTWTLELSEEEKEAFDAIGTYWVKLLTKRRKQNRQALSKTLDLK